MRTIRRLLVTADLHYGLYPRGDANTRRLAEAACDCEADALAIAGDVGDADADLFGECLGLFAGFDGLKLVVPGNHDLWSVGAGSSERKYREVLPAIAADRGFCLLDRGPQRAGEVGFIGSIGWYDYSFRNRDMNVPLSQYERKELPGICVWNDARYVDWGMTDHEFTERCLRALQRHYRSIEDDVESVVCVLHHVPFRELLYPPSRAAFEFCRAFMGSERFGKLLLGFPKVRWLFCGHRHGTDHHRAGQIEAFAVGSEYNRKRLFEVDLESGELAERVFGKSDEEEPDPRAVAPG
jgi:predicted phosphohydrolase